MFTEKERLVEFYADLFAWIADGSLKVAKVTEFTLKDVAQAHRALESGSTVGKLVLLTEGDKPVEETVIDGETEKPDEEKNDKSNLLSS